MGKTNLGEAPTMLTKMERSTCSFYTRIHATGFTATHRDPHLSASKSHPETHCWHRGTGFRTPPASGCCPNSQKNCRRNNGGGRRDPAAPRRRGPVRHGIVLYRRRLPAAGCHHQFVARVNGWRGSRWIDCQ